jgi:hypothetical protein
VSRDPDALHRDAGRGTGEGSPPRSMAIRCKHQSNPSPGSLLSPPSPQGRGLNLRQHPSHLQTCFRDRHLGPAKPMRCNFATHKPVLIWTAVLLIRPIGDRFGISSARTPRCPAKDVGHAHPLGERASCVRPENPRENVETPGKGFAFPRACAVTNPLLSAGRLSLPAERRDKRRRVAPESQRLSARQAAEPLWADFDGIAVSWQQCWRTPAEWGHNEGSCHLQPLFTCY